MFLFTSWLKYLQDNMSTQVPLMRGDFCLKMIEKQGEEYMFLLENVMYKNILHIDQMEIPANKITCIVGESGAGKSTLLKLLNIMLSADSGSIYYQDKNLEDVDPVLPSTTSCYVSTATDDFRRNHPGEPKYWLSFF